MKFHLLRIVIATMRNLAVTIDNAFVSRAKALEMKEILLPGSLYINSKFIQSTCTK